MASNFTVSSTCTMHIFDDSNARYELNLKVNMTKKELSTAKLTDAEKNTYRIAKESISWEGLEGISSSRITKLLCQNESIQTRLKKVSGLFNVIICLDYPKPPLKVGERGLLSIKTVEDYMECYNQNERSKHLALNSNRLANTFTDIRHPSDLDRDEMVYLCEFLTSYDDCQRVIDKLLDSSTTEQIQSMIDQPRVKENKAQHNFIASLEYRFSAEKLRIKTETKNPNPEVSCEIKRGFFSSVFASKFPWIEGLQMQQGQLNSNEKLSDYELHMLPLKGVNRKQVTKPMKKLLDAALFSKKKTTAIMAEPELRISLFLQSYVKELLNNYRVKEPLPFFAKLHNIEDPESQLIPEVLKLYGLEGSEEKLKKMPTVWFLEGYHEIFLGSERKSFNIYQSNSFEQWPKARFVFTFWQKNLSAGDENCHFAPIKEFVTLLKTSPFGPSDIEEFLNKYTKKPGLSPHWTKEKYLQCIGMLQETINNPFYLKQLIDCLSGLNPLMFPFEKNKMDGKNSDKRSFLLDLIVSSSIMREVEKLDGKITAKDYCEVIMDIARLMLICSKHTVSARGSDGTNKERQRSQEKQELLARIDSEIKEKKCREIELQSAEDEKVKKRLLQTIKMNNSKVLKFQGMLEKINLLKKYEGVLDNYLFGEKYRYIHMGPMITQTANGDKKFTYDILKQYLLQLTVDPVAKMRLIALLK